MSEADLETHTGFLVEKAGACPLVCRAGCWPLVVELCQSSEVNMGSVVFRQPECRWLGLCPHPGSHLA